MARASSRGEHRPSGLIQSQPSWLLARLALVARRLVDEALADEGVRRAQFSVLSTLAEDGPMSQAELGRRLLVDRSDIHGLLRDLETRRLVARRRDEADRRRKVVELTGDCRRALVRLERAVAGAQAQLLGPLQAADRRKLVELLTTVVREHESDRE